MIDKLLEYVAPHPCFGCTKLGRPLCDNCKYDIVNDTFSACIACGKAAGAAGICSTCKLPYERAWCVGERTGVLRDLIDGYKFDRMKSSAIILAELLDETIPVLPDTTTVIPIPTIPAHQRQRGYDHTYLVAREFCRLRHLKLLRNHLIRRTNTVQRLATSRRQRLQQARQAFAAPRRLSSGGPYLLLDDIMTSGATLRYAAKALRAAGAHEVWIAVVARQTSTRDD